MREKIVKKQLTTLTLSDNLQVSQTVEEEIVALPPALQGAADSGTAACSAW